MAEIIGWKDIVPSVLGVAGFALSVFNFWKAANKDKRQLALAAFWSAEPDGISNDDENYLVIKVTNSGSRSLVVDSLILLLDGITIAKKPLDSDTARILNSSSSLPKELNEAQSVSVYLLSDWIPETVKRKSGMVSLVAKCTLSTRETFYLRDISFDLATRKFPDLVFI